MERRRAEFERRRFKLDYVIIYIWAMSKHVRAPSHSAQLAVAVGSLDPLVSRKMTLISLEFE